MTSPKIPEGLQAFLRHAESLHPSNNARRENGFAKEFQVFYCSSAMFEVYNRANDNIYWLQRYFICTNIEELHIKDRGWNIDVKLKPKC